MGSIAIDFGTTNTAVAYYGDEVKQVIAIPYEGRLGGGLKKTLPSIVAFDRKGEKLHVGDAALSYAQAFSHLCVDKIKRIIGKSYETAIKDKLLSNIGYNIVEGEGVKDSGEHLALVEVGQTNKKKYLPEEIASMIFREAKDIAEAYLRMECGLNSVQLTKIVVTVPAYFDANQKSSIREAARLAGFDDEKIELLNEPTAAVFDALREGKIKGNEKVLVINVGAGTTDLAVVEVHDTPELRVESWAVGGDAMLGGIDMDIAIVNWVIEQLRKDREIDSEVLKGIDRGVLRVEAEDAKIALSEARAEFAEIRIPEMARFVQLTKSDLDSITRPIIEKCKQAVMKTLEDRGVTRDDFNGIIFTGGPTTMPILREAFVEEFGNCIIEGVDPMTCVAKGAAASLTARYTTVPSRPIILSIEDRLEEIVSATTPIPTIRNFKWKVQPSESRITIGVIQETEKSKEEGVYLNMGEYTCYIMPQKTEKTYHIVCSVGKEEDDIKVIIVPSEELNRCLEDPESYRGLFAVHFTRLVGNKIVQPAESKVSLPNEVQRVIESYQRKSATVGHLLYECSNLMEAAKRLRAVGFSPPEHRGTLITRIEFLTISLTDRVHNRIRVLAGQNLSDSELDNEMGKLLEEILTSDEFRKLKDFVESEEWKKLIEDWIIPKAEISRIIEEISKCKATAKKMLDVAKERLTESDNRWSWIREVESALDRLDFLQNYYEGKDQIKVWSEGGRIFIEGRTLLERLRSLIDHYLSPLG